MEIFLVLLPLLLRTSDGKDFTGTDFRTVFVNTTGSNETVQFLRVINPSKDTTWLTFSGSTQQTALSQNQSITLNVTKVQTIRATWPVFVTIETFHRDKLVDAFSVIPVESLGTEYYVIGFCRYGSSCRITVLGVHNSTNVYFEMKVIPAVPVYRANGSVVVDPTFPAIINSGDTLTFDSYGDLSGTRITANKTIAVFFSTVVTDIYNVKNGVTRQILPSETLGMRYVLPRIRSDSGGLVKIVAGSGDTQVEISVMDPVILSNRGDWISKAIPPGDSVVIDSDKPILVAFIELEVTLQVVCPKFNTMVILPPVDQWLKNTSFVIPSISDGRITIVTHEEDINSVTVDNSIYSSTISYDIPGTAYSETEMNITQKRSTITKSDPPNIITAYKDDVFRIGKDNSSCTFFGLAVNNDFPFSLNHGLDQINQLCVVTSGVPGDFIDNDCDGHIDEDVCINDSLQDCDNTQQIGSLTSIRYTYYLSFLPPSGLTYNMTITITPMTSTADVVVYWNPIQWPTMWLGTVPLGESKTLNVPTFTTQQGGTYLGNFSIKIVSNDSVMVVGQSIQAKSAIGAFLVYSSDKLGKEYFPITGKNNSKNQCVIIATRDNTTLRILLKSESTITITYNSKIYRRGEIIMVSMRESEAFLLSANDNTDLTGSRVRGNKPIAVFCGGEAFNGGIFQEQMLASEVWGRHYIAPNLYGLYKETLNLTILSKFNENNVTIDSSCGQDFQLNLKYAGSYVTVPTNLCTVHIFGQKEISVAVNIIHDGINDPAFLIIPSTEQYIHNTTFVIPDIPNYYDGEIHLGVVSVEPASVMLNGTIQYLNSIIQVGVHRISSVQSIFPYVIASGVSFIPVNTVNSAYSFNYVFAIGMQHKEIWKLCLPITETFNAKDDDCDSMIDEEQCYSNWRNWMFEEDCHKTLELNVTIEDINTEQQSPTEPLTSAVVRGETTVKTALQTTGKVSADSLTTNKVTTTTAGVYRTTNQITTTTTGVSMSSSTVCLCKCSISDLNTEDKIQQRLKELTTNLKVEKGKLSSSIRKLRSAADDRTSVKYLGFSGLSVLILVVAVIIGLDSLTLIRDIKSRLARN